MNQVQIGICQIKLTLNHCKLNLRKEMIVHMVTRIKVQIEVVLGFSKIMIYRELEKVLKQIN